MDTNEKYQQGATDKNGSLKNENQNPQRQWDEQPGEKPTDPREQQINRKWEEAQKQQQQNAQNPGVGGSRQAPSENDRNQDPTRKGENWNEEE